jgi:tRNA A-37 threonylcarbamoyl transferase component Bud32
MVNHLHRDLYPENLVHVSDGRVYTVDTTLHQVGPVEEDIAKLLVGVDTLKQRLLAGSIAVRPDNVGAIKQAFVAGYCTQARFSPRILSLFRLLALTQRWIEVLSVLACKVPPVVASAIQRTRINPFMLAYLDSILAEFQQ